MGTAIGRNPLLVVRPCHRVIGANGALAGYAGGLERKERLLQLEGATAGTDGRAVPPAPAAVAPGAVHVPGWFTSAQQRELVVACRDWATGPVPIRHTRLPNGGVMSVQTVCIGWHWQPYRYTRTADDVNGAPGSPFPDWLVALGARALAGAYEDDAAGRAGGVHPGHRADQLL